MIDPSFWRGRRVLLTGHTGFKGAWLALWLHRLGARVTGAAAAPPTTPSLFESAGVRELVDDVRLDLRDPHAIAETVARTAPEVVIHLAAQPIVSTGMRAPGETFATNVMGTVHLFEAVRAAPPTARAIVIATSDKCYLSLELDRGYREDDRLGGSEPYSSSKACQEHVAAAYRPLLSPRGQRVATARAGNVVGGGDWAADRLVPDVMRALAERRPLRVRRPSAVRPWQHVLDPLSGYLLLAQRLWDSDRYAEAWNFGPDPADARTVGWVVDRLQSHVTAASEPMIGPTDGERALAARETGLLLLDSTKARHRLGWLPQWPFETLLDATADWYAADRDGEDMRAVTLAQIDAYVSAGAAVAA